MSDEPTSMREAIAVSHPELDLAPGLTSLGEGFGAVLFTTTDGVVIRIPRTERAGLRMARLAGMATLSPILPAPIPVPLWTDPPTGRLPFGAMAYRRLDGVPVPAVGWSQGLIDDVASFLATLQTISAREAPFDLTALPGSAEVDAERGIAIEISLDWLATRVPATILDRLRAWWDAYQEFRAVDRPYLTLSHGDFWYGNLLASADRSCLAAVLDWEDAAYDDPAQDFATLLHSGEATADAIMEATCELTGTDPVDARRRRDWYWGYREFSGLAASVVAGDADEAEESWGKLQCGGLRHLFGREGA